MQMFQLPQNYNRNWSSIPSWIALRRIKAPHSLAKRSSAESFACSCSILICCPNKILADGVAFFVERQLAETFQSWYSGECQSLRALALNTEFPPVGYE